MIKHSFGEQLWTQQNFDITYHNSMKKTYSN